MSTLQITSREFRDNQKKYLDLVDAGKEVIIRRRNNTYLLSAIEEEEDFRLSPEALERIERSREQHRTRESTVCSTVEEAIKFLNSL